MSAQALNTLNTRAGPKRKRRLLQRRSQKLRLRAEYRMIATLQRPFEFIFWALEQRKGRLADKLANEDMGQP